MACIAAFRDRDGRHLLALETDAGTIRIWDPAARSLVGDGIRVSGEWIRSLAVMPTRERGDVLVVNVDTRPYPQQSESMPDEDASGEESSDTYDEREDDDSPFGDYRTNRWRSDKRSVIYFFHTDTGEPAYRALQEFSDLVWEIGVVPTPQMPVLITGGVDGRSQIWDPDSQRELGPPLKGHGSLMPGVGAVLLEDGTYAAASVREDGEVLLRDPLSGEKIARSFGRQTGRVVSVAFAPDGSWIAIGGERMVRIWDPRAGRPMGDPLRFVERSVCVVAPVHLPDEGFAVAVGLIDGRIQIWSADSGVMLGETEASNDGFGFDTREVQAICSLSSPGGPIVVASSKKRGVCVWSTANILGNLQQDRRSAVTAIAAVPVEAGEPLLACAYSSGLLELVDTATGAIVDDLDVSRGKAILSLTAGIRDGRSLMAVATDDEMSLLDTATHDVITRHALGSRIGHPQVMLTPDGNYVLAAVHTSLGVLDLGKEDRREVTLVSDLPYVIEAMAYVPTGGEGGVVAAIVADGTIHRFNSVTWDALKPLPSPRIDGPRVLCASTLTDGRHALITVDVEGTIRVLDPSTGTLLQRPYRSGCRTRTATAHSHDKRLLVALGGFDGTMLFVDVERGREAARVEGHLDSVANMTVLARTDTSLVVSGSADGSVLAWESPLRPREAFAEAIVAASGLGPAEPDSGVRC